MIPIISVFRKRKCCT